MPRPETKRGSTTFSRLVRERLTCGTSLTVSILVLSVVAGVSCDRLDETSSEAHQTISIALVGPGLGDSSWPVLSAAAEWFDGNEKDISVEAMAPDSGSALAQRAMLEQLRDDPRYDVVCVLPYDPTALPSVLREIVRYGKTVITIGHDVPNSSRYGYCGPSEFEIGRSAARACATLLEGRAKTIMLLHAGRDRDAEGKRLIGFEEEMKSFHDLRVLKGIDCGGKALDALHLVRKETRKYPRTGCWVFLDDWAFDTLPVGDRLLPLGNGIILCHTSSRYFRLVENGQILALITYDLREAIDGSLFLAAQAAEDMSSTADSSAARNVSVPCEIVTARNMEAHRAKWIAWTRPDYRERP